jgi:hypothetical protein
MPSYLLTQSLNAFFHIFRHNNSIYKAPERVLQESNLRKAAQ